MLQSLWASQEALSALQQALDSIADLNPTAEKEIRLPKAASFSNRLQLMRQSELADCLISMFVRLTRLP